MPTTITLVLVVVFSFLASRFLNRLTSQRSLLLSGSEYLIVGLLLGPLVTGVLHQRALDTLLPGVALLLGLIGFVLGLPLRDHVAAARLRDLLVGALCALLSAAVLSALAVGLLFVLGADADWVALIVPGVVLGCAGVVVSSRLLAAGIESLQARGVVTDLLQTVALTGNTVAVLLAGLALDFDLGHRSAAILHFQLPAGTWLVVSGLVGLICGGLFALFHLGDDSEERTFLATVGVVLFASGIAVALSSSPLLVCMVAGLTVSLLSPHSSNLTAQLDQLERPVMIVLMIFAGALWVPLRGSEWLLVGLYLAGRWINLLLLPQAAMLLLRHPARRQRLGAGLRSQGILAVALALSLQLSVPRWQPIASAIVVGVLFYELGAGIALRRLLADAGELSLVDDSVRAHA
ncbi:MAG: hypothetical protein ACI8S6_000703 [Myxococcota bacterium]